MDALVTVNQDLVSAPLSSLPTVASMQQRMAWMTAMRPVLLEFIKSHMDPSRHMYSFENNRYTPLTKAALTKMIEEGRAPAINQNGIHNLMSLYECYPDEPTIHESREDGFYTCRATLKLISFRTGQPMGAGTGSCSTRESKYAYRWIGDRDIPKGTDKTSLRQREMTGRNGPYTRYRLDNEDIADVEATVLQMAVKRAKSAAVKALPLVSEMFAGVGDPDEEKRDEDAARQELLTPLRAWMQGMKAAARAKAILAVFGEPLGRDDVAKLDEDRLAVALQVVEIGTKAGIDWASATLLADLKAALQASANQAKSDLFGDGADSPSTGHAKDAAQQPQEGRDDAPVTIDPATGEILEPAGSGTAQTDTAAPTGWRDTLLAHEDSPALPDALRAKVKLALKPASETTDSKGLALADAVLACLDAATE